VPVPAVVFDGLTEGDVAVGSNREQGLIMSDDQDPAPLRGSRFLGLVRCGVQVLVQVPGINGNDIQNKLIGRVLPWLDAFPARPDLGSLWHENSHGDLSETGTTDLLTLLVTALTRILHRSSVRVVGGG
jgi:hypothetical protein